MTKTTIMEQVEELENMVLKLQKLTNEPYSPKYPSAFISEQEQEKKPVYIGNDKNWSMYNDEILKNK